MYTSSKAILNEDDSTALTVLSSHLCNRLFPPTFNLANRTQRVKPCSGLSETSHGEIFFLFVLLFLPPLHSFYQFIYPSFFLFFLHL